jgi:hypothetical protein
MKEFFKKTFKFLIRLVLLAIMLTSAQHCMNLPFGWAGIGYLTIFCVALTVWGLLYYNEGIKTDKDFDAGIIRQNVTICIHDDGNTAEHLDKDENIIAFMTFHPNNIKSADFYYSLLTNKQIITIVYENENDRIYNAVITQIKLLDENTLKIYYTVINN